MTLLMFSQAHALPDEICKIWAVRSVDAYRKEQIEVMFREVYLIVCMVGNNV